MSPRLKHRLWKSSSSIQVTLAGALLLVFGVGEAQNLSLLGNLVFEAAPVSSGTERPASGARSSAETRELTEAVERYQANIERLQRDGAPNPEIIEQLALLGVAFQGLDRHAEAIEVLDEGIELTIQDSGQNNPQQIPLQEQMIPSYLALGDAKSVTDTEELVYSLKEERYGPASREMYFATINLADWYTAAYFRDNYQPGRELWPIHRAVFERPQRSIAGGGIAIFDGTIKDIGNQDINDPRLIRIEYLYRDFQKALRDSGNAQLDVVIDIAKRVARLAYVTKQEMEFERDNPSYAPNYEGSREQAMRTAPERRDVSYRMGREALEYVVTTIGSFEGVRPESLATALLDLGDWHLAYGEARAAEMAYVEAYQALLDAGFTSANIDVALATELPIMIPVFATHLHTRSSIGLGPNAELSFRGYVDVAYTVDGIGNASDITFLRRSADETGNIERLLERQLKTMKFRPRLRGGELSAPGRIEARYHYAY